MNNNLTSTNKNAKLALTKSKSLLNITNSLLSNQESSNLPEDEWIEKFWKWANKNNIPDYKIPRNKEKLLSLEFLDLNRQQISEIPSEIYNLSNLKKINVTYNYLTELPKEITQLNNLEELSVSNNKLTSLPKEIARLRNLKELSVGHNKLTSLPNEISSLTNLTSLGLCQNKLKDLPEKIVYLRKLNYLWIQDNEKLILDKKQKEWLTYLNKEKKCFVYGYNDLLNIVPKDDNRKYWIDYKSDLMWDIDLVFCTWNEAFDYIEKLNTEKYKGFNDWRVPEIGELKTLIDKEQYKSRSGKYFYINPSLAYSTKDASYWSETTYANNYNYAEVIDFLDGTKDCARKNLKQYLRCVRDNFVYDDEYEFDKEEIENFPKNKNIHKNKIPQIDIDNEVKTILEKLEDINYAKALKDIEDHLDRYSGVVEYVDTELENLKKELKALESKLQELVEQKTGYLNDDIEEFNREYNLHLGELIKDILNLKKEILYKQTIKQQNQKAKYQEDIQTFQDTEETITELKFLLNITNSLLSKKESNQLVEDKWMERLWIWATENNIPDPDSEKGRWFDDKHETWDWGIPREKTRLLNLLDLDLSCAIFNGKTIKELPIEINYLTHIKVFNIHNQNLLSKLPDKISNLKNLERLNLASCKSLVLTLEEKDWINKLKNDGCIVYADDDLFSRIISEIDISDDTIPS